ncbi:hybrid sensor histidine kinase/response regulator [Anaerolineales bacterium HSG25]|nr:hybrid sensor histidine kinase/response regulator [Anaerolineales bacterium HSG25]
MSATPSHHTGKILVVDDQPANLDILFRTLKVAGHKVLVAKSGQSAIRQAERTQPDIILLDVMMPGMNGFITGQKLKENKFTQEIPVIFMTALNDIDSKVMGFEVGAVDYVTKPFEFKEILARINAHLTIRKLQQELQYKNDTLQTQNEELNAFAHTVAHDLKNPLLPIIISVDLLAMDEGLSPSNTENIDFIRRNANKMNNIIHELLTLAGVRKAEVVLKPLDMKEIIAEAQERLMHMIVQHQAEIIMPSQWPRVLGHAPWAEEVWVNYLSNAMKYGGSPPRVEIGAMHRNDGMVEFWVKDNGAGLTPEEQNQLFIPFTRLNQVQAKGHGLGLSIVHRIIRKLGGTVGVQSEKGNGSRFSFNLPHAE